MSDKPKKKKPYMEIWSEDPAPNGAYEDLLEFVKTIKPENVSSFYCLVNKKSLGKRVKPAVNGN